MSTKIEWCDETWNPTTGCDQVSPGCDHCYALTLAKRLKAMGSSAYQEDGDPRTSGPGFALQVHEDRLSQPLRWTKPRRIFVNSMSDLFHPKVPDAFIARVFNIMGLAEQHTFQVLTKRPKRMRSVVRWYLEFTGQEPLPNVWLGTSVEDQQRADERIPPLLDTPAAVRFLSCEPLLGPVRLFGLPQIPHVAGIDWVIVGGESGPGARPMHPQWARDIRDQCDTNGVPFLFKQWGAWAPATRAQATHLMHSRPDGYLAARNTTVTDHPYGYGSGVDQDLVDRGHPGWARVANVGKHAAGRVLDGRTWDQFPQAVTADA